MPTIEIKDETSRPPGTLKILLRGRLAYRDRLSLAGSVAQTLEAIAPSVLGQNAKFEIDVTGRSIEVPEVWFNLGKKYYIFFQPDTIILHARHNRLDLNGDPLDIQVANIIKTAEY